jgi:hypothetical protein
MAIHCRAAKIASAAQEPYKNLLEKGIQKTFLGVKRLALTFIL